MFKHAFLISLLILFSSILQANDDKPYTALTAQAKQLINEAFIGIPEGENIDHHVHVVGVGGTVNFFQQQFAKIPQAIDPQGCLSRDFESSPIYINPERFEFFSGPILYVKTKGLMSASGITGSMWSNHDEKTANDNAIAKLYHMVKNYRPDSNQPGKFVLLAMDGQYDDQGAINRHTTDLLIPNDYVVRLANCMNRLFMAEHKSQYSPFVPAISIHPSRPDAISELKRFAGKASFLKWLPNSMNINPSSVGVLDFLKVLKQQDITLITHTGHERATEASPEHQKYGNPSLHQQALSEGVKVIMAHAGYRGHNQHAQTGTYAANTELFNDMLQQNPKNLKGGLSATIFVERAACIKGLPGLCIRDKGQLIKQLEDLLRNMDNRYACHMVNGSDFPLPAVSMLNPVDDLVDWQLLNEEDADPLHEIWQYNPMLFDFVLKRHLRIQGNTQQKLADTMFLSGGC